jgi:hypothetical protein
MLHHAQASLQWLISVFLAFLGFLDQSCYFSFKKLLSYPHEAEWTPLLTHYISENVVASGIKPGTSGSVARNSDHYTTEVVTTSTKHFTFGNPKHKNMYSMARYNIIHNKFFKIKLTHNLLFASKSQHN